MCVSVSLLLLLADVDYYSGNWGGTDSQLGWELKHLPDPFILCEEE
jgi:hypothetical protein